MTGKIWSAGDFALQWSRSDFLMVLLKIFFEKLHFGIVLNIHSLAILVELLLQCAYLRDVCKN